MGTFGNITSDRRQCAFPGGSTDIQTMALGGTGANLTAIAGGLVYSTATQLAITAAGTSTQVLHGNGAGAPTWGAVALTTDVSGVLPVANGGTNKSSWTDGGVVFAGPAGATLEQTATTFFWDYALARLGIGNNTPQVLLDLGLAGTTAGVLRLAGSTSGNVTIQPAAAAGTWTLTLPITDGAANEFLKTDGAGVTSWSSVVLTTDVSGTLPVGNGGSGATTLTGALYGNGAGAFTASVGTANYLPKWGASAPYLTGTSLLFDSGTAVGIGTASPGALLNVSGDANSAISIRLNNVNLGTAAASTFLFGESAAGGNYGFLEYLSSGFTTDGIRVARSVNLWAGNVGGLNLIANAGPIRLAANGYATSDLIIDSAGNIGFGTITFGTSAAKVLAIGNGTAPTTSPVDVVQMWSADRGGTAGKASLHLRTEDGTQHVFGDLCGIGTLTPGASAKLQIDSTTSGFLPPRMTKAQRDAIGTPANGLMLYQTDGTAGVKAYVGGAWVTLNTTADP